ncbi:hypothetical protein ACFVSN_01315 [Kitasatospora sp. NPDC057904]
MRLIGEPDGDTLLSLVQEVGPVDFLRVRTKRRADVDELSSQG